MRILRFVLAALIPLLAHPASQGADYPDRVVRVIASAAAGSALDLFGRTYVEAMREQWGQPAIFDPRGAATGMVATRDVAKSAPGGYTILLTSVNHVLNSVVRKSAGYDPLKDFEPVALVVKHPLVLLANPSYEVQTLPALIALAKQRPDQLVYSSGGIGGLNHLAMEELTQRAGVKLRHIPFNGTPAAITALIAGEPPLFFSNLVLAMPHISSGRARALAVSSPARLDVLPQVPTLAETIPGLMLESWYAVLVPAGTPRPVVDKIGALIQSVTEQGEFKKKVVATGGIPQYMGPAAFKQFLAAEHARWSKAYRATNVELD